MRQVPLAPAEHLLSHFSCPFFGVKLLYDYGFWRFCDGSHATPSRSPIHAQLPPIAAAQPPCMVDGHRKENSVIYLDRCAARR
jgi:hypothetical protein